MLKETSDSSVKYTLMKIIVYYARIKNPIETGTLKEYIETKDIDMFKTMVAAIFRVNSGDINENSKIFEIANKISKKIDSDFFATIVHNTGDTKVHIK